MMAAAAKRRRLRAKEAGGAGHPQGWPGELEKPGHPFCFQVRVVPSVPSHANGAVGRKWEGTEKSWQCSKQLHPGRCGREEGGVQPRPLVTRCHLLLPRWRLAQTMAARWRGGPSQPQSLASADTYCPRITLRSCPNLGLFAGAVPLPGLSITCSTFPPGVCTTVSFFRMHAVVTSCVFACLPAPPSVSEPCLSMYTTVLTTEQAMCGTAGPPLSCPVESV